MSNVYTYDEKSQKWRKTIPPMPTARYFPSILSLQSRSALVVAGGNISLSYCTATVEVFNLDSSQWYTTDPLPTACGHVSLIAIDNTCYALGGYDKLRFNSVSYAAVGDLLGKCVAAYQTTQSSKSSDTQSAWNWKALPNTPTHGPAAAVLGGHIYAAVGDLLGKSVPAYQITQSSDTQSAWKALPNTPTYGPAAAVLGGHIFAVGGTETPKSEGTAKKEIYMYSPSTNSWIYVSDLPAPRCTTTVANLSSNELLVVGGWDGIERVKTMYACTLTL